MKAIKDLKQGKQKYYGRQTSSFNNESIFNIFTTTPTMAPNGVPYMFVL